MTCQSCVRSVGTALRLVPGVHVVHVDLIDAKASIQHERDLDRTTLVHAVTTHGFAARLLYERPAISALSSDQADVEFGPDSQIDDPLDLSAITASCCAGPALGDLGKLADAGARATSMQVGLAIITAYIAGLGTLASLRTVRKYGLHLRRVNRACTIVDELRLQLDGQNNKSNGLDVLQRFLAHQREDLLFIQLVPGAIAGIASFCIALGTLMPRLSVVGLALSSFDGILHACKSTQLFQRYNSGRRRNSSHESEETVHIRAEMTTCKWRIAGGIFTAVGAAALVPFALVAYGVKLDSIATGLLTLGIATLLPGVVLSVSFTPYRDLGVRSELLRPLEHYYHKHKDGIIDNTRQRVDAFSGSPDTLRDRIRRAEMLQTLSRQYRRIHRSKAHWTQRTLSLLHSVGISILSYALFHFPERLIAGIQQRDKETQADALHISFDERCDALDKLAKINSDRDESSAHIHAATSDNIAQYSLNRIFFAFERDARTRSGIMKLLAAQVLDNNGTFIEAYKFIFVDDGEELATICEALAGIRETPTCCIADTSVVFAYLKQRYALHSTSNDDRKRDAFYALLCGRIDQYITFVIPHETDSDIRYYSRYLSTCQEIRNETN